MSDDSGHAPTCGCRGAQASGESAAKGAGSSGLAAGLTATRRLVVDRERTIDFMGEAARVYATPMLVRDVELTCRDLLLAQLQPGQDSVGTRIELDHLAATLLGMEVVLAVTVTEVKGRSVTFAVEGRDPLDTICRGTHVRFVVDRATTEARLAAKAAKAAQAAGAAAAAPG